MILLQCPRCKSRMSNAVLKRTNYYCPQCGYKKTRKWATFKEQYIDDNLNKKEEEKDILRKLIYECARDFDELCIFYMIEQIKV